MPDHQSPPSGSDVGKAIEWLRAQAKSAVEFANLMQDRRTAEYKARGDTDAHYAHITIEETREWHIAALIARLEAEKAALGLLLEAACKTAEVEAIWDKSICRDWYYQSKRALSPKSQTNGETEQEQW